MRQRQPRQKSDEHLKFIRGLPCLVCLNEPSDPAHVRYADLTVAKPFTGRDRPDDKYVVPLCRIHHEAQHNWGNERDWWQRGDMDPVKIALALWSVSGDQQRAEEIIRGYH